MITEELIKERIERLQTELATLKAGHERICTERNQREADFQKVITSNQNRFQQITGAITQLGQLLNGQQEPNNDA